MKVKIQLAPPVVGNPYDECCAGSHEGETVIVFGDRDRLEITIQEMKSGIGPSYNLSFKRTDLGQEQKRVVSVFDDDAGNMIVSFKTKGAQPSFEKDRLDLIGGN